MSLRLTTPLCAALSAGPSKCIKHMCTICTYMHAFILIVFFILILISTTRFINSLCNNFSLIFYFWGPRSTEILFRLINHSQSESLKRFLSLLVFQTYTYLHLLFYFTYTLINFILSLISLRVH